MFLQNPIFSSSVKTAGSGSAGFGQGGGGGFLSLAFLACASLAFTLAMHWDRTFLSGPGGKIMTAFGGSLS